MSISLKALGRVSALVTILGGGSLLLGSPPAETMAQETTCWVSVCRGGVCVSQQVVCPDDGV
jgi:hypothetical protein